MCVASVVSDYYMRSIYPTYIGDPVTIPQPKDWDPETKEMMRKLLELLDKVDKRLGDKECIDDKKKAFYEAVGYEANSEVGYEGEVLIEQ